MFRSVPRCVFALLALIVCALCVSPAAVTRPALWRLVDTQRMAVTMPAPSDDRPCVLEALEDESDEERNVERELHACPLTELAALGEERRPRAWSHAGETILLGPARWASDAHLARGPPGA